MAFHLLLQLKVTFAGRFVTFNPCDSDVIVSSSKFAIFVSFKQRPVDPEPYDGVFNASRLGNSCIQDSGVGWLWLTHPGWNRYSEDCLNLDVYTPAVHRFGSQVTFQ